MRCGSGFRLGNKLSTYVPLSSLSSDIVAYELSMSEKLDS